MEWTLEHIKKFIEYYTEKAGEKQGFLAKIFGGGGSNTEYEAKAGILQEIFDLISSLDPQKRQGAINTIAIILAQIDAETKGGDPIKISFLRRNLEILKEKYNK